MENKIYVFTSGYSYPDWVGPYYPLETNSEDYIKVYSQDFNAVELNYTYYRQPKKSLLINMLSRIEKNDFIFSIKAHQSLTHKVTSSWQKDIKEFCDGIEPIFYEKKLATILFQFPYSFHYTDENRKYLGKLAGAMKNYPLSFEFRNREWFNESTIKGLEDRKIGFVNVDEPDLKNLPKPTSIITSSVGYIRFHGRNAGNWWNGSNVTRYDYLYTEEELNSWTGKIIEMISKVKILLISFNNHYKGQAIKNAFGLKKILIDKGLENVA